MRDPSFMLIGSNMCSSLIPNAIPARTFVPTRCAFFDTHQPVRHPVKRIGVPIAGFVAMIVGDVLGVVFPLGLVTAGIGSISSASIVNACGGVLR